LYGLWASLFTIFVTYFLLQGKRKNCRFIKFTRLLNDRIRNLDLTTRILVNGLYGFWPMGGLVDGLGFRVLGRGKGLPTYGFINVIQALT
jgi:hypothetical protein